LQIVKSAYLNEKSSDFDTIWYTNAHLELGDRHDHVLNISKIQGGVRTPL